MNGVVLEIKKTLKQPISIFAILMLAIMVGVLLWGHIDADTANNRITGFITQDKIDAVIETYHQMMSNPDHFENGVLKASVYREQWKPYVKFEKYITQTFESQALTAGEDFYKARMVRINARITDQVQSDKSRTLLYDMQEKLSLPFWFEYHEGWQVVLGLMRMILLILMAALAVLIAPVFSLDYQCGIDAIVYATKNGHKKLFFRRYVATMLMTTVLYGVVMLIFSGIVFSFYGFGGASVPVQLVSWFSPYNMNAFEAYLFCVFMGYCGCCVFTSVLNWIAMGVKKMHVTLVLGWLLLLVPFFITKQEGGQRRVIQLIEDLMPTNLSDAYHTLGSNGIYELFGRPILQPMVQIVGAFLMCLFFFIWAYHLYKNHQVKGSSEVKL